MRDLGSFKSPSEPPIPLMIFWESTFSDMILGGHGQEGVLHTAVTRQCVDQMPSEPVQVGRCVGLSLR